MAFFLAVVYAALACANAAPATYGYAPAAPQTAYAPAPAQTYGGAAAATMAAMKDTAVAMDEAPVAPPPPPRDYQFSYNINDEMAGALHQRVEQQKDGVITGTFAYTAPDGKLMTVKYVADEKGYRPEISESQAPTLKTNSASTYTMNLPDAAEPVQVSITQQEMDAMRAKAAEMEKAAAYPAYPQAAAPPTYAAPTYAAPAPARPFQAPAPVAAPTPVAVPAPAMAAQPAAPVYQAPRPAMPVRY